MKKRAWLLCLLCLFCVGQLWAQKGKAGKKQKKDFLEVAVPACIAQIEGGDMDASMANALDANGYCTCMMESLVNKYSLEQLAEMFSFDDKTKSEVILKFFEDKSNYSQTLDCMKANVKDEKVLKNFILRNSFGLETCVASLVQNGLDGQINSEGYCKCMFAKMETDFTLDQLLSEKTYETEEFKVLAMECILANVRETEGEGEENK